MQVKKGDLVYDPFVGTGSILVAAAHFGAHTMGADIDIRVVRDGEQPDNGNQSTVISYIWKVLVSIYLVAVTVKASCRC